MRIKPVLAVGLTLFATLPAYAQSPRTVPYFIMHQAERLQMDRTCTGGMVSPLVDAECANANQAGYWIRQAENKQRVERGRLGVGSVDSPAYFDANPLARMITLKECIHPSSAIRPSAVECQAARISAGQ